MQIVLRISHNYDHVFRAEAIDRLMGVVLTTTELQTVQLLIGGFFFTADADRSPMQFLTALQQEGFDYEDFDSIQFDMER